ncbi:hypothetical protein AB0L13_45365 [Saccharopolyspora shandongensis]|uniref:NucA/NucB deoxyribonuclease domain-containing protein n=1 Tax=Saccharopolyspora shandongensis TaxID=418495 RepID=UPI0034448563
MPPLETGGGKEELRELLHARSIPSPELSAEDDPNLSPDQNFCVNLPESYISGGVAVSYERLCQVQKLRVDKYMSGCGPTSCLPSGTAEFRLIVVGYGTRGDRSGGYVVRADNWAYTPGMENEYLALGPYCMQAAGPMCEPDEPLETDIASWSMDGGQGGTIILTSFEQGGLGPDMVSLSDVGISVAARFNTGAVSDTRLLTPRQFRCDSAQYLAMGRGCSFIDAVPVFHLDAKEYPESVRHIADALYDRAPVVPNPGGRKFPGSIESGQPLTRNFFDVDLQNRATRAKDAACAQYFPNKPGDFDCDEYPFNKTYQSAGSGGPFTIRAIPYADNRGAGGKFSVFMTDTRILHADPFFIVLGNMDTVPPLP